MVPEPLCSRERCLQGRTKVKNYQSTGERILGKLQDCNFYLINLFPEFQTPYPHFSSYKKGRFEMRGKSVFRIHNLASSPIATI